MGQEKTPAKEQSSTAKLKKLNVLVESVCGYIPESHAGWEYTVAL